MWLVEDTPAMLVLSVRYDFIKIHVVKYSLFYRFIILILYISYNS